MAGRSALEGTSRTFQSRGSEESWGIWEHLSYGSESVTYQWRRGNLVVEVHIQCIETECPPNIRRAVRSWAIAVDEEAQSSH
jgi:hypothetical protein